MIYLTYGKSNVQHSGHVYELVDYFYYLRQYFDVKVLLIENVNIDFIERCIEYRYKIDPKVLINNIVNFEPNKIYETIISTDGFMFYGQKKVLCKNYVAFRCKNVEIETGIISPNKYILQDNRIYNDSWVGYTNINYVKKIYFDILLSPTNKSDNYLFYVPYETYDYVKDILVKYEPKIIISDVKFDNNVLVPPIKNLFDKFVTYVYTGPKHKFDCSNRLIKECHYFNKNIIFEVDDIMGIKERFNDSVEYLHLKNDQFIIDFLRALK
jgi:hypothetical protein